MYIGTLTLSLFLAVFGAVLLAVVLGNQIARPLLLLADGVQPGGGGRPDAQGVAAGHGRTGWPDPLLCRHDTATGSMRARRCSTAWQQVNAARANLQTILDNLTAGVIVLDAQGVIRSSNPGATRILQVPLAAYEGRALERH